MNLSFLHHTSSSHTSEDHHQVYRHIMKNVFIGLGIGIVFVAGVFLGTRPSVARFIPGTQQKVVTSANISELTAQGKDLSSFWNVWDLLHTKYPFTEKEPTDQEKIYGAMGGLVASYKDPYTMFFPPQQAKLFNEQVKGSFGGIGIEVGMKNNLVTVIAPLKSSAAERAGIKSGDIIAEVDGVKTLDVDIDTIISKIRGTIGSSVTLGLARKGSADLIHITVQRAKIEIPIIDTTEQKDVFIISLYSFSENSAELFTQALEKFAASKKSKLIIDLRGNPGGYLDTAINIASYFLPKDAIVVREDNGPHKPETTHVSNGFTLLSQQPRIVILQNGGSASASEILAGALHDHEKATLIGKTSFGKGSVQELMDLPDGSAVKITVAKWLTPKGTSISEKGIAPDIQVTKEPVHDTKHDTWSDPDMDAAMQFLAK